MKQGVFTVGKFNYITEVKFTPDRPLLTWQRKYGNFNTKLAITQFL